VKASAGASRLLDFPAEEQMSEAEMFLDGVFVHGDWLERRQSAAIEAKEKHNRAAFGFIN
jgi:hypothetical protein